MAAYFLDEHFQLSPPKIITIVDSEPEYPVTGFFPSVDSIVFRNEGGVGLEITASYLHADSITKLISFSMGDNYRFDLYDHTYNSTQYADEAYFFIIDSTQTYDVKCFWEFDGEIIPIPLGETSIAPGSGLATLNCAFSLDGMPVDTLSREIYNLIELSTDDRSTLPSSLHLDCYPNPFNAFTLIRFRIPSLSGAELNIYNLKSRLVWSKSYASLSPGEYTAIWDATNQFGQDVSSGVYVIQMATPEYSESTKIVVLR